jgi:hypothetical protein
MHDLPDDTTKPADCGPMGCQPSLADLFCYMDGVMDEVQRAQWDSRVHDCTGCGHLYRVQASFRALVEVRCRTELPPDLAGRIFASLGIDASPGQGLPGSSLPGSSLPGELPGDHGNSP